MKMEWIKVTDRLPESNTSVLAFGFDWFMAIQLDYDYKPYNQKGFWLNQNDEYSDEFTDITHWMPLPNPPKD